MNCPRRINEIGPWNYQEDDSDHWKDDCCSFCGSINPDKVIELIKSGYTITRTDKNYKIYLNYPSHVKAPNGSGKVYLMHFSREQIDQLNQALGYIA
ncbi:MAG: hypothetical protein K5785_00900 [Nitrosarchaeum sp.]|nr:hypothetical protein [Nitrosarchaeum sp.]